MIMDKGMDTGDILLMKETPIHKTDNAQTLHDTLSEMGGTLVLETLKRLEENTLLPTPQDHGHATYAPKLKKGGMQVDAELFGNFKKGFTQYLPESNHDNSVRPI